MTDLIKELLAVPESQLLQHPKVVAAWKELTGRELQQMGGLCTDIKKGMQYWKEVPGSLADMAFEMRDACDTDRWEWHLVESFFHYPHLSFAGAARKALRESTSKQQIIAATLAWWEGQGV